MYKPFDHTIFRFPQFSFEKLNQSLTDKSFLTEIYKSKEFQEAIYIASPNLFEELQKYLLGKIDGIEKEKLESSLFRYLSRMSTRCTPFGSFAGVSTGSITEDTNIDLSGLIKKHTRLDMFFLCSLFQFMIKIPDIRKGTVYFANSTIYEINNKYRYIEYYYTSNNRKHQIVEIKKDYFVSLILQSVKKGKSYSALKKNLIEEEVTDEESEIFLDNLIDSQIIVNELEPTFTGEDYLLNLVRRLEEIQCEHPILPSLEKILSLLEALDNNADNYYICYENIFKEIEKLGIPCNKRTLFQVDSTIQNNICNIGSDIIDNVGKTIRFLNKITVPTSHNTLDSFKRAFRERYEDQEICLLEVLDPNIGLGYPVGETFNERGALLANWAINSTIQGGSSITIKPIDRIMQKKIFEYDIKKDTEIVLSDEDVEGFNENWNDLPLTISAKIELIDSSVFTIGAVGNSSAANIIARFSHCGDEIEKLVQQITFQEQEYSGDKLLAEIIHLPESRMGNILSRPHCRDFELVYLAASSNERSRSIPMQDLMISVKNNRLIIRSKSLNKEILPRLTSAHNFQRNPTPVYLFLCDMQFQNIRGSVFFNWSNMFQGLEYLPRVVYSNAILSPTIWNIPVKEWQDLQRERDDSKLIQKASVIKNKYHLQDEFVLVDGDNTLYVNIKSPISIRAFLDIIKNRQRMILNEFLHDHKNCPAKSSQGSYRNECIIAFYRDKHENKQ